MRSTSCTSATSAALTGAVPADAGGLVDDGAVEVVDLGGLAAADALQRRPGFGTVAHPPRHQQGQTCPTAERAARDERAGRRR